MGRGGKKGRKQKSPLGRFLGIEQWGVTHGAQSQEEPLAPKGPEHKERSQ